MKKRIIDKRGRLFGKVNIIDLGALIFAFCFIGLLIWGNKIIHSLKGIEVDWKGKYYEEISQKEAVFKEHPRIKKYFKKDNSRVATVK